METVKQAPDLNPDVRNQLVDVIQAALRGRDAEDRGEMRRQRQNQNVAEATERMLANENLLRKQQKIDSLMQRFNSLMNEGRYKLAEESVAAEVLKELPEDTTAVSATLVSRIVGYNEESMALRVARQKGVVDTLAQVEGPTSPSPTSRRSSIPTPKSGSSSAAAEGEVQVDGPGQRGLAEKKIAEALKSPTELEFVETPLADVIDYLKTITRSRSRSTRRPWTTWASRRTAGHQEPQGHHAALGAAADAPRPRPDLHDPGRSAADHHARRGQRRLTTKVYPVADLVVADHSSMAWAAWAA